MSFSLQSIATHIGGEVVGDATHLIESLSALSSAKQQHLSFLSNNKYLSELSSTQAGGVILTPEQANNFSGNAILHNNPYVGFALAAQLLDTTPVQQAQVSEQASVHPSAQIGANVGIAAGAVIEADVQIGEGSKIGANTFIGKGSILGKGCSLKANVTLYHQVVLGDRVSVHSGTVIGSDGFGYANDKGKWIKIPQMGSVRIGDDTEIGANTCIDRGALDDTIIGKNCIIDNLVQIAHNCTIGDYTCICGNSGMAGSVNIGKHVVIAGCCAITGHIDICDKVQITGFTMVTKSITKPGVYSSGMPATATRDWQKNAVQLRSIDKLYQRVKTLESDIKNRP